MGSKKETARRWRRMKKGESLGGYDEAENGWRKTISALYTMIVQCTLTLLLSKCNLFLLSLPPPPSKDSNRHTAFFSVLYFLFKMAAEPLKMP